MSLIKAGSGTEILTGNNTYSGGTAINSGTLQVGIGGTNGTIGLSNGTISGSTGAMLVFIPCVGEYVTPELLGGPTTLMIGRVIWDENFSNNDPPVASAIAVVLVLLIVVPLALFNRYQTQAEEAAK